MNRINVILADDHQIVLEGIKAVLKDKPEVQVIGEASNGIQVLELVKEKPTHIVILDINMPQMDGLTCARRLKQHHPNVKIIILTMFAQKSFVEEILRIGVDGCLLKSNTGKELGEAISRVMSGKSYYDRIQSFSMTQPENVPHKLSNREIEIIKLLAQGLTSHEIATKLFIAEHTVKTHRKNILRKINVHTTAELMQFALNSQLI